MFPSAQESKVWGSVSAALQKGAPTLTPACPRLSLLPLQLSLEPAGPPSKTSPRRRPGEAAEDAPEARSGLEGPSAPARSLESLLRGMPGAQRPWASWFTASGRDPAA